MNFNPLPPHGGRPFHSCSFLSAFQFQSTPSAWRETRFFTVFTTLFKISIHSLRMEGDNIPVIDQIIPTQFQSTPSAWRETFFYGAVIAFRAISIHSLRMEGDCFLFHTYLLSGIFQSTPSAWRETDLPCHHRTSFQSTPSAWRETREFQEFFESSDISIHSLRMEGDIRAGIPDAQDSTISIHSLRMEGDSREPTSSGKSIAFQSTPSAWRETHK